MITLSTTTIVGLLYVLVSVPLIAIIYWTLPYRDRQVGLYFLGLVGSGLAWAVSYGIGIVSGGESLSALMFVFRTVSSSMTAVFGVLLAATYADMEWHRTPVVYGLVAVVPVGNLALGLTNQFHHLVYTPESVLTATGLFLPTFGPWFLFHVVVSYFLLTLAVVIFAREVSTTHGPYRKQAMIMLISALLVWFGSAVFVTEVLPVGPFDPTPLLLVPVAFLFHRALFEFDLFELSPVARQTLMESMTDGAVAVNTDGRIIDLNQRTCTVFDLDRGVIGDPVESVFDGYPDLLASLESPERDHEVAVETFGDTRYFDVNVSPIRDVDGVIRGTQLILRDITRRKRRERELQTQNERLDQFATVVSHDLRNPLMIAQSYLDLVETKGDDKHIETVANSLDRMDTMIDELLALARVDFDPEDTIELELESLVEDSWKTAHTDEATLETAIPEGITVEAEPELLRNVFENLFRNATEHANTRTESAEDDEPPVTITVGVLEDSSPERGFFVEDDGDGIDPADRESVFEQGFTTSADGTGFGLSIVSEIVDAHGWSISVTEGTDGGARFEVVTQEDGNSSNGDTSGVLSQPTT